MYNSYKGHKIELRNDNRYQARFYVDKKQITIYGKTKEECYNNLKLALKDTTKKQPKNLTFHQYCDLWYKTYKMQSQKEITQKTTIGILNNHIKKQLQDIDINQLTPLIINTALTKINGRPKEYASQYLREIFKQAYKDKIIKIDIYDSITKYSHKRKEGTALTKEQRTTIINACNQLENGEIFLYYMFTGCRKSEGLRTTIDDINDNYIRIPGTKTHDSDRIIPKFKILLPIIEKMKNNTPNLFGVSEKTINRRFLILQKLCGFKFQIKDLRTTFGTICAEQGINDSVIAKWMGHTTTNTTKKYYIKVLSDFEKENAIKFDTQFDT